GIRDVLVLKRDPQDTRFLGFSHTPLNGVRQDSLALKIGPGQTPGSQVFWLAMATTDSGIEVLGGLTSGSGFVSEVVPTSKNLALGDIAVGPNGELLILAEQVDSDGSTVSLSTFLDPDGLGNQPFEDGRSAFTIQVPTIEAQGTAAAPRMPHVSLGWD